MRFAPSHKKNILPRPASRVWKPRVFTVNRFVPMLEVIYDGNLGNNLFQYCFGRILAEKLGYRLKAKPLKGFPRTRDLVAGKDHADCPTLVLRGQKVDLSFLEESDPKYHLLATGYFQRFEYYAQHRTQILRWLTSDHVVDDTVDDDDLVVGVRRGRDYIPRHGLPLSYYETAIGRFKYKRLFICSDSVSDPFVRYLATKYQATIRPAGALDNLAFIRRFKNIVISNSTFLWWAAYLSEARTIIFPRPQNGFWSAAEPLNKNIDLEVPDARYRYLEAVKYKPEFLVEKVRASLNESWTRSKGLIRQVIPFPKRKLFPGRYQFTED